MVYVTGDCHGEFHKLSNKNFPQSKNLTRKDYVIICGDFGNIWDLIPSSTEKYWYNWLCEKSYTILFIDGNHENFDRLYQYPIEDWHGGKVHKIRRKKAYEWRIQNQRLMEYSMRYPKKWQRFLASQKELSVRDLVLYSERCVPCIWKDK